MKFIKNFFTALFTVSLFSLVSGDQVLASEIETIMTQDEKKQALDSLEKYEQSLTEFALSDASKQRSIGVGENGGLRGCVNDEECEKLQLYNDRTNALQTMEYDDESNMIHRAHIYYINEANFLSDYGSMSESYFSIQGDELEIFKDTVLYHYLGHDHQKMKAKLMVTTNKYIGIQVYLTLADLTRLAESDIRILDITHTANSGLVRAR